MAKHHKLELTEANIQALVELRDKTAMLKIHQGFSPHEVARKGLLKPRDPEQTRWTLRTLGQVVPWLKTVCVSGIHQSLSRLGISYKRARDSVRHPDVDYAEKLSCIQEVLAEAREHPETCVVVYQDEFRFKLQPTLAKDWAETGTKAPLARQSHQSQETCYGIGALNPLTGDVVYQQVKSCTVSALHTFYTAICHRYPTVERIYLIQDNRAIHFHANLRAALLPQTTPFAKPTPPKWTGKLSQKIGSLAKLPIEILQLPTYASWTNPIEKLWQWVRQSVIHEQDEQRVPLSHLYQPTVHNRKKS